MTSMFLKTLGFIVHGAASAQEAFEVLERSGQIDILLTDLVLGEGDDGLKLTQALKTAHPQMRHILMTGYADERSHEMRDTGDAHLLTKPFRLASLEQAIAEALSD